MVSLPTSRIYCSYFLHLLQYPSWNCLFTQTSMELTSIFPEVSKSGPGSTNKKNFDFLHLTDEFCIWISYINTDKKSTCLYKSCAALENFSGFFKLFGLVYSSKILFGLVKVFWLRLVWFSWVWFCLVNPQTNKQKKLENFILFYFLVFT